MLFLYNQKKINVVHRTRISDVMIFGSRVVQEVTEAAGMHHISVDAAQLTARIQVSSPAKDLGWLKTVKQFAIHAQVSLLSIIFRDLSSPLIDFSDSQQGCITCKYTF